LAHDRNFAKVYIPEKRALLGVLTGGNPQLFSRALSLVEQAEKELAV
jgi:hypothetical protein